MIALVLVSFLIGFKNCPVIILPLRNKQSIGVGVTSTSNWNEVWQWFWFVSRHLVFKVTDEIVIAFAPHWFWKQVNYSMNSIGSMLMCWKWWLPCACDWLCNCFDISFWTITWKPPFRPTLSSAIISYVNQPIWMIENYLCDTPATWRTKYSFKSLTMVGLEKFRPSFCASILHAGDLVQAPWATSSPPKWNIFKITNSSCFKINVLSLNQPLPLNC